MIILPSIKTDSIDMILTDPPYNTTSLKMDKQSFNLEDYMQEFKRVLKPNGWLFCFGSLEIGATLLNYFKFRFQYIWEKQAPNPTHGTAVMPMYQHENIWAMCHKSLTQITDLYMDKKTLRIVGEPYIRPVRYNASEFDMAASVPITRRTSYNPGYREGTTILRYRNKVHFPIGEATAHPTQKPLALCQLLCKGYCKPSGIVLDPFMGSGTTPLAAKTTARQYIGIEINPKYYKMAQNRVQGTL